MQKLIFTVLFILPSFSLAKNLHCKKLVEEMIGGSQRCFYQGGLSNVITAFSKYSAQWNKKGGESIPFFWFPVLKNGMPKTAVTMAQLPKSRSITPFPETKNYPLETAVAGIGWKNKNKAKIMGCVYKADYCLSATSIQKKDKVFIEFISI